MAIQADELSKRVDNAHNPLNFLPVFGHAGVDFKKVNGNDFTGIRAVLEFTISVFMLGIIYGFREKTTFAGGNNEFDGVVFAVHIIVSIKSG